MYNSKDISIVLHMKEYCEDIRRTVNRFGNSFEVFLQDLDYRNLNSPKWKWSPDTSYFSLRAVD